MTKLRAVVADDHILMRDALVSLLERQADLEVVGVAADGAEAWALLERCEPDLAVLDVAMGEMTGIEVTRRVRERGLRTRVLIVSMHDEGGFVRAALGAGAAAYLLKTCESRELIEAVRAVAAGRVYISPLVAGTVVSSLQPGAERSAVEESPLTGREREVLRLVAIGRSSKEIASELGVSPRTVDAHRAAIMAKLKINNVPALVIYAIRHHLIVVSQ